MGEVPMGPQLCVAALFRSADSLVMVRRGAGPAGGSWDLPRSAVTAGETAAEALVRAVEQDIGATVVCGPFAGWSELVEAEAPTVTLHFEAIPIDAGTVGAGGAMWMGPAGLEVRAVPLWQVSELRLCPGLAELLADSGLIDLLV